MSDEVPLLKRSKRTSCFPLDIWLDSFLELDRFSLDACQICNRAFRSLVEHRTADVCRRQIRETAVRYKAAVSGSTTTDGFSAAFEADDRSLRVAEEDIEIFKREFKKAAVQGSIDSIDINGKMPTDKLKELFLFANPQIKGERKLNLSAANVTPQLFRRLVEASLVSEITEDISLDLISLSMDQYHLNVQRSMRSAWSSDYDENFLHYDDADSRCDSSVQFEFPGEIRLQVVLFQEEFSMRRGRRRGWEWVPKEARKTRENWEAEQYTDSDWEEIDENGLFFFGHNDYTD
ncbi:hypothetical protein AAVH_13948 [Aphelenchoides avenae]|nr:hypothetical protein AAVH_13948 [Aphelenchus avenae]